MSDYEAKAPSKAVDSLGQKPRRFWKAVSVAEDKDGFAVLLDGRAVKTPQGAALRLPTHALAEAVATEWATVVDYVDYYTLPLTRLAFAAIDRMAVMDDACTKEVSEYAQTDLLAYPSPYPAALAAREEALWQPVRAWAETALGLKAAVAQSVMDRPQSEDYIASVVEKVANLTAFERAGFMLSVPILGSVLLAFALKDGFLTAEQALLASRVGEDFQAETWGADKEVDDKVSALKRDLQALELWFAGME